MADDSVTAKSGDRNVVVSFSQRVACPTSGVGGQS
jgi:hypothetical protein